MRVVPEHIFYHIVQYITVRRKFVIRLFLIGLYDDFGMKDERVLYGT